MMEWFGIDLAKPNSEKTVIVIPDDAGITEKNGEIIITFEGKECTYQKGTIVFSQSGLKNACDWSAPPESHGE